MSGPAEDEVVVHGRLHTVWKQRSFP